VQVILTQDMDNLGASGDVVMVRDGYGRNYLIPRGLAVPATPKNVQRLAHDKTQILAHAAKQLKLAKAVAERIESLTINIPCNVGEEGKLFGSVTAQDVADALAKKDVAVSRKQIRMPDGEPIKALGLYAVGVHLARDLDSSLKVWVVSKEGEAWASAGGGETA
jgi:large subunit ribosomal protein L9